MEQLLKPLQSDVAEKKRAEKKKAEEERVAKLSAAEQKKVSKTLCMHSVRARLMPPTARGEGAQEEPAQGADEGCHTLAHGLSVVDRSNL